MSEHADADSDGAVIGIDLGTTNSVIAAVIGDSVRTLVDADGNQLHPSVVSFMPTGERLVGHRARARRAVDPENTVFSVKRIIGRPFGAPGNDRLLRELPYRVVEGDNQESMVVTRTGRVSVIDVAATVLIYLRQVAEGQLARPVTHCVVTVPANFSDAQREATRQAVKRAGMQPLRILNEPTAAALAYGTLQKVHRRIAVFDMGGGTFDVTVLAVRGDIYEVLATGGDPFLGGDDMDRIVADHLSAEFHRHKGVDLNASTESRARVLWAAEEIKKQLTRQEVASGSISDIGFGPDGVPLTLDFHLSRQDFEERVTLLVDRALQTTKEVLDSAGVVPGHIDEVILVGGSTLVPVIRERVAGMFGRTPLSSINPMQVVAAGAAIHAASLSGNTGDVGAGSSAQGDSAPRSALTGGLLLDVTSHSLGLATAGGYVEFLIEKNTPIPAEGTRVFRPARDNQTTIRLRVCQGESKTFADNSPLGEIQLDAIPASSRAQAQIEVSFLVDANGMLQVSARDLTTGREERANLSIFGVAQESPQESPQDSPGAVGAGRKARLDEVVT